MKRLFFPALLSVVLMSSCSKNEVTEVIPSDTNLVGINIASGITKGVDTTTALLEGSAAIKLYAYGTPDGTNNQSAANTLSFGYSSSAYTWSQTTAVGWGYYTLASGLSFYSMHDGKAPQTLTSVDGTSATLESFTQDTSSDNHTDLVYHASTISAQPVSGNVSAYHTHALSKIDIYANTGSYKAYIARVRMVNVYNEADAIISSSATDSYGNVEWSNIGGDQTTYSYYEPSSVVSFSAGSGDAPIIATDKTTPSIMMIPQTLGIEVSDPDAQIPEPGDGIVEVDPVVPVSDSYIEVIYILTNADDSATGIGYLEAQDHPNYASFDSSEVAATDPLYVMAAFSLANTFEANKAYSLNLGLGAAGSTGGLNLTDNNFVDEDGNIIDTGDATTNLPNEGESFFPDTDSKIGVIVTSTTWGSATPVSVD